MQNNNKLSDLRVYTGESGGTHGLDDVSKGNIYLDEVFGLPHCKYHGAMLKVAPDGIWRCGITDAFQRTQVSERSEMAISHGCYFDNKKIKQ